MKKLVLGAFAFFLFSISFNILETSCEKEANASTNNENGTVQLNKIIFDKVSVGEIWIANYDGTGQIFIAPTIPSGYRILQGTCRLSPDGKKIFFNTEYLQTPHTMDIYSCNVDGSNLIKVIDGSTGYFCLGGVY